MSELENVRKVLSNIRSLRAFAREVRLNFYLIWLKS